MDLSSSEKLCDDLSVRTSRKRESATPIQGQIFQGKGFSGTAQNLTEYTPQGPWSKGNERPIRINMITVEKEDDSTLP